MAGVRVIAALGTGIAVVVIVWVIGSGLIASNSATPAAVAGAPRLIEQAEGAGLEHVYDGDFDYVVGGGVAVVDCNADELPDLYVAGGIRPASLFVNRSTTRGVLRFERVANPTTDLEAVTGAYPVDLDSDGQADLAVLRRGENVLLRGVADCRYERANEAWSFDGGDEWTAAFSARWERGAAWPTLAFGNYLDGASADNDRQCHDNVLLRPAGASGYGPPEGLSPGWCTLSMLFSDWDRSGRRDLRVSNDRHYYSDYSAGQEQLWRIDPGVAPREYTDADGWQTVRVWGMGIASHDVTGDGHPDYYLTSQGDNKLQALADGPDGPRFADVALERGVTAHRPYAGDTEMPSTAWHGEFDDVNNDGWMDLFVAKGNVESQLDHAARDPSNLLLGQPDGTFVEAGMEAGLADFGRARGAAVVDLNGDGLLDLVVVDRRENVRLYRNDGSGTAGQPVGMGNWLAVRLMQPAPNRDAIGAWIEVHAGGQTQLREMTVGGGHAGGQLGPVHFGLGGVEAAEVRVTWPDGEAGSWQPVPANQIIEISR